jgi:phage terminase small subunit
MKLPANLHIVRGPPRKKDGHDSFIHSKSDDDLTSDWIDRPEQWDRTMFITNASNYLQKKNGALDTADRHLLSMLASQIEIYVESILKLRSDGLVMAIKQLIFCKFHEQVLSCCANEPNQGFMVR